MNEDKIKETLRGLVNHSMFGMNSVNESEAGKYYLQMAGYITHDEMQRLMKWMWSDEVGT